LGTPASASDSVLAFAIRPTTVVQGESALAFLKRFPMGFWFGQYVRAKASLTTATCGALSLSDSSNKRPRSKGIFSK